MIFTKITSESERQQLEQLARSAVGRVTQRALMVMWSSNGVSVREVARQLYCRRKTVRQWLHRYQQQSSEGLFDCPGHP